MYKIDIKETEPELITFVVAGALTDEAAADLQHFIKQYREDAIAMAVDLRAVHRATDKAIETLVSLRRSGMELQRVPAFIEYWMNAVQGRGKVSRTLLAVAAIVVMAFVVSARAEEPMTLDQAVAEALEHNRLVSNASLEVDKAEAEIAVSRSKRYPQIQLSIISSKALSEIELETNNGDTLKIDRKISTFGVTQISQPLTQLRDINLGIKLAEETHKAEQQKLRSAQQNITYEVKRAYIGVIQLDSAIEAADRSLDTLRELDRQTIQFVSQGSALKSDLLNIKAKAASAEYEALVLRNKRADATRQLNNLLGRNPESEIVLAGLPLPTGNEYQQPTIDNRPDLRESEARIKQAELDLRLERGDFIPKASLQVTSATTSSINSLPNTFSSAALVVRWEPYTWGRRKAQIAQKKHVVEQARNSRDDVRATAEIEIHNTIAHLKEARLNLIARSLEVDAASESLRVTGERHKREAAGIEQVLDRQTAFASANANHQEALGAYWIAKADFDRAIGKD